MKKFIQTLVLLTFICAVNGIAQIPQSPSAALSPNAASLGVYGDIPVSLYTGTPEISISLYDIKVKDFTLHVSLSYHAAGIRVDQRPGWTGLGWTLFAGGAITRSVNSMPDELNHRQGLSNAGYYYNYNCLNVSNWNTQNFLLNTAQNMSQTQAYKDNEPDEFSFNFAGYSGKFYLDHNGNWIAQCNKPVKVELHTNLLSISFSTDGTLGYFYYPCFRGFTITAEDGVKYEFGGNANSIDCSISFFNQGSGDWVANAWYLTKIILPTTEEINFTYERNEFNSQMYFSAYYMGIKYNNGIPDCFVPTSVGDWYNGKLISPVYLKKITTAHSTVTFEKSESAELNYEQEVYDHRYNQWRYGGNSNSTVFLPLLEKENPKNIEDKYPGCLQKLKWYKLDNIKITENNSISAKIIKIINFNYSNSPNQRLTLNSIKESGKPPYTFSYNNIDNMPGYLANKSDHWGFYNGIPGTLSYANYYDSKNPNAVYTKYGLLTKITYPTGGYTEFEFEPHYYRKQLQENRWQMPLISYTSNQLAGGVRIKRVKNSTAANGTPETIKEYYYVSDYLQNGTNSQQSSGVMGGQAKYYFDEYIINTSIKISVFSSNSVLPACQNISSNHIGYTEVIEKMADNSFVRYQFTNFDNGYMDEQPEAVTSISRSPYEPCNSKAMDRGLPILKEYYRSDNKKLKSLNIEYERTATQEDDYVRSMKISEIKLCNTFSSYLIGSTYKIFTNLLNPKKETETYYDTNTGQALQYEEKTYTYNSKKLLSEASVLGSDGKRQTTKLTYPFESNDPTAIKMTNKNMLSYYTEKITYIDNGSIINGERIKYNETVSNSEIIKPELVYLLNTPAMINQNLTAQFKPEISYKYNDKGNMIEDKREGNQISTAYLWGYKNQYPIAEIRNATCEQVKYVLGQTFIDRLANANIPDVADLNILNNLRNNNDLQNIEVTTYTYKPLIGIETVTYPNGIKHIYEYDLIGRLRMIRDGENNIVERYKYRFAE